MLWLVISLKLKRLLQVGKSICLSLCFFPCAVGNINGTSAFHCMVDLLLLSELSKE
jgi:uncharacterized membrane protein YhaH (DUF805 family)